MACLLNIARLRRRTLASLLFFCLQHFGRTRCRLVLPIPGWVELWIVSHTLSLDALYWAPSRRRAGTPEALVRNSVITRR
ncbi:hypothetical protein QBC39DRAFT_20702 [Podospora conica]|nr:hypothetical protein QBC39DRAFT_20702 [Schizothecium conicum]